MDFLYQKQQQKNTSPPNEWDWLKKLQPFDADFEQAINEEDSIQQRANLDDLFK